MSASPSLPEFPRTGNSPATGPKVNPVRPMRVLRQHLWVVMVSIVMGVTLGTATWYLLDTYLPKYMSQSNLQVGSGINYAWQPATAIFEPTTGDFKLTEAFMLNCVMMMRSESILNDVLRREEVRSLEWSERYQTVDSDGNQGFDLQEAREEFEDHLVTKPVRGSTLIEVKFLDRNRENVQVMLRHLLEVYQSTVKRIDDSMTVDVKGTFTRFRQDAEQELRLLHDDLTRFLTEHDIHTLDVLRSEAAVKAEMLTQAHIELQLLFEATKASYDSQVQSLRQNDLTPSPEELAEVEADPAIAMRDEQQRAGREKRGVLKRRFGEEHRLIKDLDEYMVQIKRERENELRRLIQERRTVGLESTRKALEGYSKQIDELLPRLEEVGNKLTDLTVKLEEYEQLEAQRDIAQVNRERADRLMREVDLREQRTDASRITVTMAPTEPRLVFPLPEFMIPGVAILTLMAVVGALFLREMFDQRVKSPSDVRLIPNLDMLGTLPDAEEDPFGHQNLASVVRDDPAGLMAESFRQVRTSLLARMDRRGYKTLLLSGAQPQCGVSVVAANLTASLGHHGRKVLLLDANFRRPQQHELLGISSDARGLVEVLRGQLTLDEAIVHIDQPQMDVLPAGALAVGHPELLEGQVFRDVMAKLESCYDLVLIDGPPALLASDAVLLAKQVDAIAIVVRAMANKRGTIERMVERLNGGRADILGVVLNGVRTSAGGYFRKNYREFYQYTGNGNDRRNGKGNGQETPTAGGRERANEAAASLSETDATQQADKSE